MDSLFSSRDWRHFLIWIWFGWVFYRSLFFPNRPTLSPILEPTEEEKKLLRRKNHQQRLLTALIYVPFVPASAILEPIVFQLFILMMGSKGIGEYIQIISITLSKVDQDREIRENKLERYYSFTYIDWFLIMINLIQGIAAFSGRFDVYTTATFFCLFCLLSFHMLLVVMSKTKIGNETLFTLALHMFGFLWISWTSFHAILPYSWNYAYTGGTIAIILWTSWLGDASAYYVGSRFGTHPIFPHVSPKKSWEGTIATVIFSILLCYWFKSLESSGYIGLKFPPISTLHYLLFGLLVGLFDIMGDICASFVKRLGRVKDSGTFFTGHGGIIDRFDSFYFVGPVIIYYLNFLLV